MTGRPPSLGKVGRRLALRHAAGQRQESACRVALLRHDGEHGGERRLPRPTAIERGCAAFPGLSDAGFRILDSHVGARRGASLTVASETITITVDADWYDHELSVHVQVAGAQHLPIERLLPELRGALHLPGDATRGVLQRRFERIVRALQARAPEVLEGGQPALDRVLRAGAEPA